MVTAAVSEHPDGVAIRVWVVPRASRSEIRGLYGGRIKVRVMAPPEAGMANREVSRLLGERLGVPVVLLGGRGAREKVFLARGIEPAMAVEKLAITPKRW